jgi:hypothetical protein
MAVGETSGQSKPRAVVSSAAARRRTNDTVEITDTAEVSEAFPDEGVTESELAPLVKEGDEEFERLLAEEEAIEASTREQHETPHFRAGDAD